MMVYPRQGSETRLVSSVHQMVSSRKVLSQAILRTRKLKYLCTSTRKIMLHDKKIRRYQVGISTGRINIQPVHS